MKKNVFVLGDSYSTYKGYIPEGYYTYYSDERDEAPIIKGVEKTWWHRFAKKTDANIVVNDSWSGSTICNTMREAFPIESSFINRIDKYIREGFFEKNKIDRVLILGGTNDCGIKAPLGALKYSSFTAEDLKCILPAFCYLIDRLKDFVEDIVVILNTEYLTEEVIKGFISVCEKYGLKYICLEGIERENGHPTELGMKQICDQVSKFLAN